MKEGRSGRGARVRSVVRSNPDGCKVWKNVVAAQLGVAAVCGLGGGLS
jgi:hypothetical protein